MECWDEEIMSVNKNIPSKAEEGQTSALELYLLHGLEQPRFSMDKMFLETNILPHRFLLYHYYCDCRHYFFQTSQKVNRVPSKMLQPVSDITFSNILSLIP